MGGERNAQIDVSSLLSKRQQIIGSTLRARPADEKARLVEAFVARFGDAMRNGRIRPVIDSVIPFERVSEAHARVAGDHFGKVVLTFPAGSA